MINKGDNMSINDVLINEVTPMMRQYIEIKKQNMDIILFFRLGDFYEMFFEDALVSSKVLDLTLTGKNAGLNDKIPMCGIPHHAAALYIEKLVEMGYKVGICEQLEDAKDVKGIVKRDIVKVVTKGTIISDALLEYENNYLGSISDFKDFYVLTYADITTGDIYLKKLDNKELKLINEIVSTNIKEVIMTFDSSFIKDSLLNQFKIPVSNYNDTTSRYEYIYEDLSDVRLIGAVKNLLSYIEKTQKTDLFHFKKVIITNDKEYLKMDIHTKRNLELTETKRLKSRQYSLIWLLDKTKTAAGSRMLKRYIESPTIDKNEIEFRYNYVDKFRDEFLLRKELESALDNVYDLERLSGRIVFGATNAKDLLQLKKTLASFPSINNILNQINFPKKLVELNELHALLEEAIYENPPFSIKEGFLIKDGFNSELDELKDLRKGGKDFLVKFETEERERTGIKNLKVGYNRVFGYYIEVSKGNTNLVKDEFGYDRKQTLSNCERYISPVLKEKEALILNAEEKIIELEYNLFISIRDKVKNYINDLQKNADVISEIDVLQSFAVVSEDYNFVRPEITLDNEIEIIENRHPIIERVSDTPFVPNDIIMDKDTNILLITGPNMAGKSTYIRQLAITVIMAQIGCFVPARSAKIPVIDAIFTRIGSSDDLVSGESTFMVEMNEANYALQSATKNSLILFDELGRGTATFDGIAIAQAIIEYIHNNIGAKSLFSTHYHELTDLENHLVNLKNVHVSAIEEEGNITFLHKIKKGSVDKSYGIHVASLASLPEQLIKRASSILKIYENTEIKRDQQISKIEVVEKESIVDTKLRELNLESLTPIEALNLLYKLKEELK